MARRSSISGAGPGIDGAIEFFVECLQAEHRSPTRNHLNRKWQSVDPAAYLHGYSNFVVVDCETGGRTPCPFEEKLERRRLSDAGDRRRGFARHLQRWYRKDHLAGAG